MVYGEILFVVEWRISLNLLYGILVEVNVIIILLILDIYLEFI